MTNSLFSGYDIMPFLNRQTVPYVAPRAPDISNLLQSMDLGHGLISQQIARGDKMDQQDREEKLRRDQLKQQADLEKSQQGVQMRGQDIMEGARKDTNERLDRDKAEQYIRQALTSGDEGDVHALDLAAKGLGWTREELPTNHAPATPAPAQPQFASATAPPQSYQPNPKDLESGGGNPAAVNPHSRAAGIGQIMPDEAKALGYTPEQVAAMSPAEQRALDDKRLMQLHGFSQERLGAVRGDPGENYMATTAPAYAGTGAADDKPIYARDSTDPKSRAAYNAPGNAALWDVNHDGTITAGELRQRGREGNGSSLLRATGMPEAPMLTLPDQQIGPPRPGPVDQNAPSAGAAPGGPPAKFLQDYMQSAYGIDPLSQQGAAPAQGGGRHVFRDRQGNVVAEIDLPAIRGKHMDSLDAALGPILDGAKTPAEKQAAEQAKGFAVKAVDSGQYTWKDAANKAIDFYQKSVGEAGKTSRAGIGDMFKQTHAMNLQADHILGQVSRDIKLPALNDAERDLQGTVAALGTGSGTGDVIAVRKLLKSIEGRATDADYQSVINSSGWVNRFLNLPENVLEGRLTPEVIAQIRQNVQAQLQQISQAKAAGGEKYGQLMEQSASYAGVGDDVKRQLADRGYNYFFGNGAPRGANPSAPSSSPSDEDLIKGAP